MFPKPQKAAAAGFSVSRIFSQKPAKPQFGKIGKIGGRAAECCRISAKLPRKI
ncbi:MAG: hypothetical protein HAW59_05975 [Betaproteobacteria bacterium]|nr:hypothetical protein [Betaproteobacteria bacterium]